MTEQYIIIFSFADGSATTMLTETVTMSSNSSDIVQANDTVLIGDPSAGGVDTYDVPRSLIVIIVLGVAVLAGFTIAKIVDLIHDRSALRDDASDMSEYTRYLLMARFKVPKFRSKEAPPKIDPQKAALKMARRWSQSARLKSFQRKHLEMIHKDAEKGMGERPEKKDGEYSKGDPKIEQVASTSCNVADDGVNRQGTELQSPQTKQMCKRVSSLTVEEIDEDELFLPDNTTAQPSGNNKEPVKNTYQLNGVGKHIIPDSQTQKHVAATEGTANDKASTSCNVADDGVVRQGTELQSPQTKQMCLTRVPSLTVEETDKDELFLPVNTTAQPSGNNNKPVKNTYQLNGVGKHIIPDSQTQKHVAATEGTANDKTTGGARGMSVEIDANVLQVVEKSTHTEAEPSSRTLCRHKADAWLYDETRDQTSNPMNRGNVPSPETNELHQGGGEAAGAISSRSPVQASASGGSHRVVKIASSSNDVPSSKPNNTEWPPSASHVKVDDNAVFRKTIPRRPQTRKEVDSSQIRTQRPKTAGPMQTGNRSVSAKPSRKIAPSGRNKSAKR